MRCCAARHCCPADRREALYDRCVESLRATAILEDDGANWPPVAEPSGTGRTKILVQWCHGAPGIVTGLSDYPRKRSADMDEMLVMAGQAIWQAGPVAKGPGVCHGTAGNGYAFLKLYQRTGDPIWLARARSVCRCTQSFKASGARQQYGRPALLALDRRPGDSPFTCGHCLTGSGGMPALDILD
jgi:hypothetical protein